MMAANNKTVNWLTCLAGAAAGGVVGFFLFIGLLRIGLYAMVVPGAAVGFGAGILVKGRSIALGIVCALLAVCFSIFAEWWEMPFAADESLSYFLTHLHQLTPVTYIMIALGALCAFWFGQGLRGESNRYPSTTDSQ